MVDFTIDKARSGDTESARKILKWFCGAIKANTDKNGRPYRKPSGTALELLNLVELDIVDPPRTHRDLVQRKSMQRVTSVYYDPVIELDLGRSPIPTF